MQEGSWGTAARFPSRAPRLTSRCSRAGRTPALVLLLEAKARITPMLQQTGNTALTVTHTNRRVREREREREREKESKPVDDDAEVGRKVESGDVGWEDAGEREKGRKEEIKRGRK